jgi:hypothetical protein
MRDTWRESILLFSSYSLIPTSDSADESFVKALRRFLITFILVGDKT